jgi:hypothetical protein
MDCGRLVQTHTGPDGFEMSAYPAAVIRDVCRCVCMYPCTVQSCMSGRTGSNNQRQYTDAVEFGRAGRGKARGGGKGREGKGRDVVSRRDWGKKPRAQRKDWR